MTELAEENRARTAKDHEDTNGVLVDELHSSLRVKPVVTLVRDWHQTTLDVKVTSELLERDLRIGTHDNVRAWLVNGFAGCLALFLPDALHSETAELNRL
jgi:hypothetical protein